ncbi:septal ring lytic transglycosylase RlpA family protein [Chitinimonas sp.]|uniref:septal ring lytic transglycosylase RlpA family protein n=1 Tax=Chitinimonas sp. TaxID=1934313 RepID=UPI0035AFF714
MILNRPCRLAVLLGAWLAGCASQPMQQAPRIEAKPLPPAPQTPPPAPGNALPPAKPSQIPKEIGGYYQDDGPIMAVPYDLDALPEPQPKTEPLHRFANKPYAVFGQTYKPLSPSAAFSQEGIASWYGRKFNGKNTASGEPYDMFKLTAAHPTLPVPSYAKVTNLDNGKSVVVRINDRGPFHKSRVMDMSYAAAYRLGYHNKGSARVRIEALVPGQLELTAPAPSVATLEPGAALAATDALAALALEAEKGPLPPPAEPASAVQSAPSAQATWLQLGAFGSQAAAETFKAHVSDDVAALAMPISIQAAGKVWRVRLGPFNSREAASMAADKLASVFPQRPVLAR